MREALEELLRKSIGSRKVFAITTGVVLNLLVAVFARLGLDMSEPVRQAVERTAENITELIMIYVFAQGGIDAVRTLKETETKNNA